MSGPATVLNLANWKLTLPTGQEGEPEEIHPPALLSFSGDWFRLNDTGDGVVFTAPAGGVTTSGSSYPRAELRELDGGELASWSNRTGTHTMQLREAITRLPEVKPHVVAAQIHDAENDVLMVRLEDTHLFVEYADGEGEFTLDDDYQLGTPYDLRITAQDGRVQVAYNGEVKGDVALAGEGWYFKAGTYTQSNPERGDAPDAAGEVVIYALDVTHTP
ncbi:polysaccharide lyase family 7 protein [Pseudonocardia zijingensis]|uniref:Polysaccharide lyase family 7 protein n=1 Tax=Pseudonocardia zijingensis TaxID=153376 RepID=A0ABP3ZL95_9PSEU